MEAYLTFNGNAAEALAFYAKCLSGKIAFSMTFGEKPHGGRHGLKPTSRTRSCTPRWKRAARS